MKSILTFIAVFCFTFSIILSLTTLSFYIARIFIYRKLFAIFLKIIEDEGISLILKSESKMFIDKKKCAAYFYYSSYTGSTKMVLDAPKTIVLGNKYKSNAIVIAHELGHYYSIKDSNDRSENAADQVALQLIKKFTNTIEYFLIEEDMRFWLIHTRI